MSKFYVCTKTNWAGDKWQPVKGPFTKKVAAEEEVSKFEYHPQRELGGIDLKEEIHARVFSRSALARFGYPLTDSGEHRLIEQMYNAYLDTEEWQAAHVEYEKPSP